KCRIDHNPSITVITNLIQDVTVVGVGIEHNLANAGIVFNVDLGQDSHKYFCVVATKCNCLPGCVHSIPQRRPGKWQVANSGHAADEACGPEGSGDAVVGTHHVARDCEREAGSLPLLTNPSAQAPIEHWPNWQIGDQTPCDCDLPTVVEVTHSGAGT